MSMRPVTRVLAIACVAGSALSLLAPEALAAKRKPVPNPQITASVPALDGAALANGGATNQRSIQLSWASGPAGAKFTCRLDKAAAAACTSPTSYGVANPLAVGAHTFTLTESATGYRTRSFQFRWTIDVTPPAAAVPSVTSAATGNPVTLTNSDVLVSWAAAAGATHYACATDPQDPTYPPASTTAATYVACTSPFKPAVPTDGSADGTHAVYVVALDAAGNAATPGVASWTLDTHAPDVTINGPGTVSATDTPTFTVTATDVSGVQSLSCAVDTTTQVACTSGTPVQTPQLSAGPHTFSVTAVDDAGNSVTVLYDPLGNGANSFDVDLTAPAISIVAPAALSNDRSPVLQWSVTSTASTIASVGCALDPTGTIDDTTFTDCPNASISGGSASGEFGTSGLNDGRHAFFVTAVDANGKRSTLPVAWNVDATKPVLTVSGTPGRWTNVNSFAPVITVDDANPTPARCALTGPTPSSDCGPYAGLNDGAYTLTVDETDAAGNQAATVTRRFTVDTAAPTVALRTPATLTGAAQARFDEPVTLPAAAAVALVQGGRAVAVTRVCRNGSTVVACTALIRSMTLTPRTPLVPGQHYAVTAAAAGVRDRAGNTLVQPAPAAFRAQRTLTESTPAAHYAWTRVTATGAIGGSYVRDSRRGARASYRFTGSSVTWWTVTGPAQGRAVILVDGLAVRAVNNYATRTHFAVARRVTGLSAGAHTLTVVVSGRRGATKATGTGVAVDAITAAGHRIATPALAIRWATMRASGLAGGVAAISGGTHESVTLTFRGTSVTWTTVKGPAQGSAVVYLDGKRIKVVSNRATSTAYGVKRTLGSLADKVHTLRLVTASGRPVVVDGFHVG